MKSQTWRLRHLWVQPIGPGLLTLEDSMRKDLLLLAFVVLLSGCASSWQQPDQMELQQQVMETERAFARTMATRDYAAFTSFLSKEALFFSGKKPLRGKSQVADAWKGYFEANEAPFSWEPEHVEVLDSGKLALSTGPVFAADGKFIATFTSIWRQEAPGKWRIIFDKGSSVCDKPQTENQ
jgi:ketosteroid isomerase-like protein